MKTIATTLPIPRRLAESFGVRCVTLRAELHAVAEARVYEERGERVLSLRNAPPTVKGAVGLVELRGISAALCPTSGDIVDFPAALSCLEPGCRVIPLSVVPNDTARTEAGISSAFESIAGAAAAPSSLDLVGSRLAELQRRQLAGAFPSGEWHRFLLDVVRGAVQGLPIEDESGRSRARVAVMGYLAGFPDLPLLIEALGGRVVYDEWLQLAAELVLASEPARSVAQSPLCLGFGARSRRLHEIMEEVDAVILITEPFCSLALEEAWLRDAVRRPLLVLESESLAPLDATRRLRLENFASMAFARRTGGTS
jgi:hypothetical protein